MQNLECMRSHLAIHVVGEVVGQVAAVGVLHCNAQVVGRQEHLLQAHDVRVLQAEPLVQQLPARQKQRTVSWMSG